jgi:hypothetical protein
MHLCVDAVLVLAPDRDLQLVSRRRQVERAADPHERAGGAKGEVALEAGRLDLRLLPQPLGLEQRREQKTQEKNDDSAAGG